MELTGITEKIIQFLKTKIITCEYAPGQRLNEIEIAEEFGVSRTPIREAIRVLAEQKLLVNLPRKGTYVTEISSVDLEYLFISRLMIERQAIELITSSDNFRELVLLIEKTVDEAEQYLAGFNPHEYNEKNKDITVMFQKFHIVLVKCARNPWIDNFYSVISPAITRYFHMYFESIDNTKRSIDNHRRIISLLYKRDADNATDALIKHIQFSFKNINDCIFAKKNDFDKKLEISSEIINTRKNGVIANYIARKTNCESVP